MLIKVYNIIVLQDTSDIEIMLSDLNVRDMQDIDDDIMIEYLLQWYQDDKHHMLSSQHKYDPDRDYKFLGKQIKVKGYPDNFLYSRDNGLNFAALSIYDIIDDNIKNN